MVCGAQTAPPEDEGPSNTELTRSMQSAGAIRSPAVVDAFLKTDRGIFLEHEDGQPSELEEGSAYIDSPMRHGILHLSAPSIYGVSLEVSGIAPRRLP